MGPMTWELFQLNWIPAQDIPTRKQVNPAVNKNPPSQSTRLSFDIKDDFSVDIFT